MSLIEKIKELCVNSNTNISELEKICGFSNSTIRKWDKSSPSVDNLKKVADHFGVTIDFLVKTEE